jgi:hypothetical protein
VAEVENIMLILAEDEHDLHTLQSIAQVRHRASLARPSALALSLFLRRA